MVAAITGINFPSLVSGNLPNEAAQQQLLKQTSEKAYSRDAITLAISKDAASTLATLKGETLPAVAVEFNRQLRNPGGKKQNPYKKQQKASGTSDESDSTSTESSDEKTIRELKARDTEVRAHEQQHISSAGPYARGAAVYDYQIGPDGKAYAIGGHVEMDTGAISGNAEATIQKARILRQAALSVSNPSGADKNVALNAMAMEESARSEESEKNKELTKKTTYKASALQAYNSLSYRITPGYMVNAVA